MRNLAKINFKKMRIICQFKLLALLGVMLGLFIGCEKDKDNPSGNNSVPVNISDFVGNYRIGNGSYTVPLDANNNPILSEKRDISGELLEVRRGNGDTLILVSVTLGEVKAKGIVKGQQVELQIEEQRYIGNLNPMGDSASIYTPEVFYFDRGSDGKKFFDSRSGNGRWDIIMGRAGNKYQVAIRRTGVA